MTGFEAWETHAAWWQAGFTQGADVEYRDLILPLAVDLLAERMTGPVRVLDIGCGEGQLSRLLASTGAAAVVGFDPARAQAEEAVRRGGGPAYARAAAGAMPFAAGAFDAAVAVYRYHHPETAPIDSGHIVAGWLDEGQITELSFGVEGTA